MQLRYLQTLLELGGEKSTIVFPLPMDLVKPFLGASLQPDATTAGVTVDGRGNGHGGEHVEGS